MAKQERPYNWKQKSAGGFPLNINGMSLTRLGTNALKSTFASKKKK